MKKQNKSAESIENKAENQIAERAAIEQTVQAKIDSLWGDEIETESNVDAANNEKAVKAEKRQSKEKTEVLKEPEEKRETLRLKKTSKQEVDSNESIEQQEDKSDSKKLPPNLSDPNIEKLQKALKDTKDWGNKKNIDYINLKKNISQILNDLEAKDAIYAEEKEELLNKLLAKNESDEIVKEEKQENPLDNLMKRLNDEFVMFKKYTKQPDADEKYNAFFSFLHLHTPEEREKIINYMAESEDVGEVLDFVLHEGDKLHTTLYKGANKHGGIVGYVQSLQEKVNKLENDNKKLTLELDTTFNEVNNRPTKPKMLNSGYQSNPRQNTMDHIWGD